MLCRLVLFFSTTFFAAIPSFALMESLAETSYKLINGECPKTGPCTEPSPLSKAANQSSEAGENILLASLADRRSKVLQCQQDDLQALQADPKKFAKVADDLSEKIDTLVLEKRNLRKLEESSMTLGGSSKVSSQEIREANLRIEALIKSMPLIDVPGVGDAVKSQILRRKGGVLGSPDSGEKFKDLWRESFKKAILKGEQELSADQKVLKAGADSNGSSLSRGVRESLAQDQDLIEGFRQEKKIDEATMKSLSCRIDAKYGAGASYRDTGIAVGLMAATGLGSAVVKVGSWALSSSITGQAARGLISIRTAGILRTMGNSALMAGNVASGADQAWKVCLQRSGNMSGELGKDSKEICKGVSIRSLDQDNCVLAALFMASGPASSLFEAGNASKAWAMRRSIRKGEMAEAQAAKAGSASVEAGIDRTNRPRNVIPDSGRQVDANEMISATGASRTISESKQFINSPDFRDGTYVMMVVREKNGKDVLMYENRIPADAAGVMEEKIVTHRSLRQKYRDSHGGEEPDVVAAGECLVNANGGLISCLNQSGSYKDGNSSVDYLVDSATTYGFKKNEESKFRKMQPGENLEVGHMNAAQEVKAKKEVLKESPELLKDSQKLSQFLTKEGEGGVSPINDRTWLKRAVKLGRSPDPEWSEEKKKAYSNIWMLASSSGEGSVSAASRVFKFLQTSPDRQNELNGIHKYLDEFLRDAAK